MMSLTIFMSSDKMLRMVCSSVGRMAPDLRVRLTTAVISSSVV